MIVLIGESGSGKSTIEKELSAEYGFERIVSYTTRPMRDREVDGVDYHFINELCFLQMLVNGAFAESTSYNGWHYGILKDDCKDNRIVVVEPYGLRQLKKVDGINVKTIYIKVPEQERIVRMMKRRDKTIEVFRRAISDQGVFQGIEDEVDFVADGDMPLEDVLEEITHWLEDEGISPHKPFVQRSMSEIWDKPSAVVINALGGQAAKEWDNGF